MSDKNRVLVRLERTLQAKPGAVMAMLADFDIYPDLAPGVREVVSVDRRVVDGLDEYDMEVRIGFKVASGKVRVALTVDPSKHTASVTMRRGPFKSAEGRLQLQKSGRGTRAIIEGEYETPFDLFHRTIEAKLESLADILTASVERNAHRYDGSSRRAS